MFLCLAMFLLFLVSATITLILCYFFFFLGGGKELMNTLIHMCTLTNCVQFNTENGNHTRRYHNMNAAIFDVRKSALPYQSGRLAR